jgi:hypothetical protein
MNETSFVTDDDMIAKVGQIMTSLQQNQQLQTLAKNNGLDVKNTIQLTDETAKNVAVSVVALMLAKRSGDPDYSALVRAGMNHRKIRVDLINKFKDQANQIIDRYQMSARESVD